MARHKKQHHEEHIDESWLIPYADLLTLLLALFIVLFATSSSSSAKMAAMADAFQKEFGMMPPAATSLKIPIGETELYPSSAPGDSSAGSGGSNTSQVGNADSGNNPGQGVGDQYQLDETLEELTNAFKTYVLENKLSEQIQIEKREEGLLVTLTSDVWFASGSATISETHKNIAREISDMLIAKQEENRPFKVIVTGHTDNQPINTAQFRSNWVLSMARATNFLTALMEFSQLDPSYYSARGLGDAVPAASNSTAEGRQQNRRVEVYISYSGAE